MLWWCSGLPGCSQLIWWLSSSAQPAGSASALALATTSITVSLLSQLPPFWHHVLFFCHPLWPKCLLLQPSGTASRRSVIQKDNDWVPAGEMSVDAPGEKGQNSPWGFIRRNYITSYFCEGSTYNCIFSDWPVLRKNTYPLQCFISARLQRGEILLQGCGLTPARSWAPQSCSHTECPHCPGREENL